MIIAVLLLVLAVVAATAGSNVLERATWPRRSPALGIWAWHTLSLSVASAVVLAGLVLAVAATPLHEQVAGLLRSCSDALAQHYAAPGGLWTAAVALSASCLVLARFGVLVARSLRGAVAQRRSQRDALALVGAPHADGFTLVEHRLPFVYCVPARRRGRGTIVVTTAAVEVLSSQQLSLVLAHERQHLRFRHHLAMTVSSALSRTFRGLGVFGRAHEQISSLAEMHADDAVRSGRERRDLARALLSLTPMAQRGGAVLASTSVGAQTSSRVLRLTDAPTRMRRGRSLAIAVVGLAALATPVALAAGPALESAVRDCCPSAAMELPRHHAR